MISITRERGTCLSIVVMPQKGMKEGLETFVERREKKNYPYACFLFLISKMKKRKM